MRKDGSQFWASVVINPIRDKDGNLLGFAKITRDVTERREAPQALERAQEQLAQAQKMEGIGQLTGGVAHDFNNLLTVIIGNLESLQRALQAPARDGDRLARAVENAMRGAQRAASLTQRLLAFSRRQPLDPKPVDVGRLVTGMSELLRRTLGEQIAIETVLAGGLWRVLADPNQLEIAHPQSRRQRARRHAERRQAHDRDRQRLSRRGLCRGADRGRAGPVRGDLDLRHRFGHDQARSRPVPSSRSTRPRISVTAPGSACRRSTASSSSPAAT